MKRIFFLPLLLLVLYSCSKDELPVSKELPKSAFGSYQLVEMVSNRSIDFNDDGQDFNSLLYQYEKGYNGNPIRYTKKEQMTSIIGSTIEINIPRNVEYDPFSKINKPHFNYALSWRASFESRENIDNDFLLLTSTGLEVDSNNHGEGDISNIIYKDGKLTAYALIDCYDFKTNKVLKLNIKCTFVRHAYYPEDASNIAKNTPIY
ncbi:hypothetical protein K5X82_09115 [Halosquirtibacter xylanolyticus]|uniref:hypothetical protein n=1 Tax=Halosquirtibacter xylanolyticus TaxID=3374599 RepID=UPI003747AAA7|nr:hypothetical protein K5X82_09115 [Prolixibacteraceae bacterium]